MDPSLESDDDWLDDSVEEIKCFVSELTFSSVQEMCLHCAKEYSLDFQALRRKHRLDFYGSVKLANFLRAQCASQPIAAVLESLAAGPEVWADDKYLAPAMENDALLFNLDDDIYDVDDDEEGQAAGEASAIAAAAAAADKNEKEMLRSQLELMHAKVVQMEAALQKVGAQLLDGNNSSKGGDKPEEAAAKHGPNDAYYFNGYSQRGIHEDMLKDRVRTLAYRDFMYKNKEVFKGKTVLDIGCGTGILSMFAARAGAKRVIGIDAADIIDKAREIVKANELDNVVTFVKAKVEEAELPAGVDKVDIIVSEWMGYFLLFESMLPSVLFARDKWLAKGGGVYPNRSRMFVAGVHAQDYREDKIDFWKDVYGFNMSCLIDEKEKFPGCRVEVFDPATIITNSADLLTLDILTAPDESLDFVSEFQMTFDKDSTFDGFLTWFDVDFDHGCSTPINMDTSARATPTHWKQTMFQLHRSMPVKAGDVVSAKMTATRGKENDREYDVSVSYCVTRKGETPRLEVKDAAVAAVVAAEDDAEYGKVYAQEWCVEA